MREITFCMKFFVSKPRLILTVLYTWRLALKQVELMLLFPSIYFKKHGYYSQPIGCILSCYLKMTYQLLIQYIRLPHTSILLELKLGCILMYEVKIVHRSGQFQFLHVFSAKIRLQVQLWWAAFSPLSIYKQPSYGININQKYLHSSMCDFCRNSGLLHFIYIAILPNLHGAAP